MNERRRGRELGRKTGKEKTRNGARKRKVGEEVMG